MATKEEQVLSDFRNEIRLKGLGDLTMILIDLVLDSRNSALTTTDKSVFVLKISAVREEINRREVKSDKQTSRKAPVTSLSGLKGLF